LGSVCAAKVKRERVGGLEKRRGEVMWLGMQEKWMKGLGEGRGGNGERCREVGGAG
jgi:hypothetical protein